MAPVSKPVPTTTWIRRPSRYEDERGSFEESSSGEEIRPLRKHSRARSNDVADRRKNSRGGVPSFMASDAASSVNGRSYVDPWDMENYSFLRRQLEDVSLSDNDVSSTPAFESNQSDFYYVPLDGDGTPQYQYKQYVDANGYARDESGNSPLVFRDDTCGRVAGVDEHHFYNDYLDPHQQSLYASYVDQNVINNNNINNPSRQSERSRFNNQDYHTYTPPSIIKDLPERYNSKYTSLDSNYRNGRPRAKKSYSELNLNREIYSTRLDDRNEKRTDTLQNRRRSFSDAKVGNVNRRKSFQEMPRLENRYRRNDFPEDPIYEGQKRTKEKISRRQSIHEITVPVNDVQKPRHAKSFRTSRKSILNGTQSFEDLTHNRFDEIEPPWNQNSKADSLVYVYETARRRRKMVLPNPDVYEKRPDARYRDTDSDDGSASPTVPSETYSMRPLGRYAMSNYGHLKIDYSCSWNNLHRYINDRLRA